MLKNIGKYLINFKKDLEKLQKYQYNITYGLDYLLNEVIEVDCYKTTIYYYFIIIRLEVNGKYNYQCESYLFL